ncbi:hypothetical protein F4824DRAFT_55665 [Ustulina deusta]|nr:hypothetical protein F4824DRAFT_55665 [Ustulina deusta]
MNIIMLSRDVRRHLGTTSYQTMAQGGDACLREDVASSTGHLRLSSGAELTVIYYSTSTRSRVTRVRRADQHREASRRTVDALRMTRNPRAHLRWPISGPQLGWESAVARQRSPADPCRGDERTCTAWIRTTAFVVGRQLCRPISDIRRHEARIWHAATRKTSLGHSKARTDGKLAVTLAVTLQGPRPPGLLALPPPPFRIRASHPPSLPRRYHHQHVLSVSPNLAHTSVLPPSRDMRR